MSVMASRAMHFGAVFLALFIMVIVNMLASSRGRQLMKAIGEKERELVKLEDDRTRESGRWERMTTPERLEDALVKHGLSMSYPKESQIVRMMPNGRPRPGQASVAKAARRSGGAVVARYRKSKR